MNTEVQRFEDVQELNTAAAELICQLAALNVKTHGGFTLALSGGQTPRRLYETLARSPYLKVLCRPELRFAKLLLVMVTPALLPQITKPIAGVKANMDDLAAVRNQQHRLLLSP